MRGHAGPRPAALNVLVSFCSLVGIENHYDHIECSITDRVYEDVVEYCEKNKIVFIPWFPLAAGELTKPGGVLDRIAKAHKATTSQV